MLNDDALQACEPARLRNSVYGFLAAALRYPDQATLGMLDDSTRWSPWFEELRQTDPVLFELLDAARATLAESNCDNGSRSEMLQERHTQLFGHAVRGTCPAYELEYERGDIPQQSAELADIAGFYNAFGMELHAAAHERPDHATVQFEFLSVLAAKEVYAIETSNVEGQQVLQRAEKAFLADHIARWVPAMATRLQDADPDGFYGRLGGLMQSFIAAECEHFGVSCGPRLLELRTIDPQRDASIECGVEESCPGAAPAQQEDNEAFVQIGIDRV
ncbi:MAG: molecular chaperone TorD family protein [Planctomycetes bacterium]|nr:molecular chaperone TorD family protein [Planctomycetota bacterium]